MSMKAIIAAIAISIAFAGLASAQGGSIAPNMSLAYAGTPENASPAVIATPAVATPVAINTEKTQAAAKASSQRSILADSMQAATSKLVSDHASGSTELLRSGSVLELSTTMGGVRQRL